MSFPTIMYGARNTEKANSSNQKAELGTQMIIGARKFRYVKNSSAAALAAGVLVQSPVPNTTVAHLSSLTIGAMALGDKTVTMTTAFTTTMTLANLDPYVDGYMVCMSSVGGGSGRMFEIEKFGAAWTSALTTNSLTLKTGVDVALLATQQVSLHKNPFKNVIVHPSPPTAKCMGFSQTSVSTGYYSWVCVSGPTAALYDETPAIGKAVAASTGVDGAVSQMANRIVTSSAALTTGTYTSNLFYANNSLGAAGSVMLGIVGGTSANSYDIGIAENKVGVAMSAGGTSGESGLVWAKLEG
jgi:hypothetical protein